MGEQQKIFRYRYEHPAQPLERFLSDRYRIEGALLEEALTHRILINGRAPLLGQSIEPGDQLEYLHLRRDEADLEDLDLPLIYQDENLLVVSKPAGLPVSPSGRYYFTALALLVAERFGESDLAPLHRLDLETSGVLLFGRSRKARSKLQPLFATQEMDKTYEAITLAPVKPGPISGDMVPAKDSAIYSKQLLVPSRRPQSLSIVESCEPWGPYFKVRLKPVTGKTNQLRVHLAAKGAPILGDKKYHPDENVYLEWFDHRDLEALLDRLVLPRQALHCQEISFKDPFSGQSLTLADHTPGWRQLIDPLKNV